MILLSCAISTTAQVSFLIRFQYQDWEILILITMEHTTANGQKTVLNFIIPFTGGIRLLPELGCTNMI